MRGGDQFSRVVRILEKKPRVDISMPVANDMGIVMNRLMAIGASHKDTKPRTRPMVSNIPMIVSSQWKRKRARRL